MGDHTEFLSDFESFERAYEDSSRTGEDSFNVRAGQPGTTSISTCTWRSKMIQIREIRILKAVNLICDVFYYI